MSGIVKQLPQPVQVTQPWLSAEQEEMIRKTFLNGASKDEAAVLLEVARLRKLNPITRQIHFVKRGGQWSVQVGIDGMRALAERTGLYGGQDEPIYEHDKSGGIVLCKVAVYRKDWQRPAVGVAYWKEYAQQTQTWKQYAHVMIAKCAEALALRKAFPEDLSGLYSPEEMSAESSSSSSEAPKPTAREAAKQKAAQLSAGAPPQTIEAPRKASTAIIDVQPGETEEQAEQRTHSEPPPHDAETGEVMEEVLVPFGRDKGKPLSEASDKSLSWLMDYAQQAIADPAKAKYVESNKRLAEAIEAELDKRR